MENKKLYIGLGVLAVAGIGYYMWKKNKTENKSSASGCDCGCGCCDDKEDISNITSGGNNGYVNCVRDFMAQGLSLNEAKAKCTSGRVIKNPLKYNEIKSNVQSSGEPTKKPILNPDADCISKWLMTGASLEDAKLMCADLKSRAIKKNK